MNNILCTGNPLTSSLATAILKVFPNTVFISRANGYDLTTISGIEKFKNIIKDYTVFINCSYVAPGVQSTLLQITNDTWDSGHVINIGSTAEYNFFPQHTDQLYADEKNNLKQLSLDLFSKLFKTTHISMGGINDSTASHKMDPVNVATTIKWIIELTEVYVPIIGLENDFWHIDYDVNKQLNIKIRNTLKEK
jgi:hypothetical protein